MGGSGNELFSKLLYLSQIGLLVNSEKTQNSSRNRKKLFFYGSGFPLQWYKKQILKRFHEMKSLQSSYLCLDFSSIE